MLRNRLVASILWMFVVSLTFNRHLQLFLRQNFCRHEKLKATRATKFFFEFSHEKPKLVRRVKIYVVIVLEECGLAGAGTL